MNEASTDLILPFGIVPHSPRDPRLRLLPLLGFLWTMPSSPKSFYGRPSAPSSRRPAFLIISCLLIGISGFLFGITSFLWPIHGYRCLNSRPRSVRVVWEHGGGSGGSSNGNRGIGKDRHKVMGFVGIQTGFGSVGRRHALRKTWLPSDRQGLERYLICYAFWISCVCVVFMNHEYLWRIHVIWPWDI